MLNITHHTNLGIGPPSECAIIKHNKSFSINIIVEEKKEDSQG